MNISENSLCLEAVMDVLRMAKVFAKEVTLPLKKHD